MAVNTVGNTLIPVVLFEGKDPARASNFGNGFFGLGYTLTPLLVVFILQGLGMSYTVALTILGALSLVFLLFVFRTTFPDVSPGFKFSMALKVLVKPAVIVAAFAQFCYTSLDASMGSWIKKLMEEMYLGASVENPAIKAGLVLSLFGVAMMAGRFLSSTVKNLTAIGSKVLISMSALSVVAIVLMITAKSPFSAIAAVILTGLAFGPIFPTIVGVTFAKFDKSLYGSIFGVVFAFGLLGGTFVPKFIGNLSVGSTVQQSLPIAAVIAGILLIISLFIGRIGRPGDQ
jgi:fucose permease